MEDESPIRRRRRRRTRRRRRLPDPSTTDNAKPSATPVREPAASPAPKPPRSRRKPEVRKPRGNVPHPDRAGISTSMAMRARELSPHDG